MNDTIHRIARQASALRVWLILAASMVPLATPAGGLSELAEQRRLSLELPDLDGQRQTLDTFLGQVVLVNFWASWCTPCVLEMPSIMRLEQALADQPFVVIGVNVSEGERRVRTAADRLDLDFLVLMDEDGSTFHRWGGQVLPTTYILDREGDARFVVQGPLEWDDGDVVETLRRLAQEDGPTTRQARN